MAVDDMQPVGSHSAALDMKVEDNSNLEAGGKSCPIHSGHFMVSRVHDDLNNDDEDEEEVASPFDTEASQCPLVRQDSVTSTGSADTPQSFGIDASLTKLFQCMTLAYSGKITSPRWKQFRGIHLNQKQRIRLNNIIWREWHMQYIYGKAPIVCQFATPLSDHIHSKPEAVVLEGKYWKRQLDTVTAEYKKWRRFFKDRIRQQHINFQDTRAFNESELLERVKEVTCVPHSSASYTSNTDLNFLHSDMDMDFTNELFANLNQPFAFPNPRELNQLGYADLIQPGLVQLQPNLEEFMDIDSTMADFLSARMQQSSFHTAFMMAGSSANVDLNIGNVQNTELTLENFLSSQSTGAENESLDVAGSPTLTVNTSPSFLTGNGFSAQNLILQLALAGQYQLDPASVVVNTSFTPGQSQTLTVVPSEMFTSVHGNVAPCSSSLPAAPVTSSDLLAQLLQQHADTLAASSTVPKPPDTAQTVLPQQPPCPEYSSSISLKSPILAQSLSIQPVIQPRQLLQTQPQQHLQLQQTQQQSQLHQIPLAQSPHQIKQSQLPQTSTSLPLSEHSLPRTASCHQTLHGQTPKKPGKTNRLYKQSVGCEDTPLHKISASNHQKKKDGPFIVPNVNSVSRKNRVIAPAPVSIGLPAPSPCVASSPSQASYLAELLKSGTYPGALISGKKELGAAMPIQTTTNLYQQTRSEYSPVFIQPMPISLATLVTVPTGSPSLPASNSSVSVLACPQASTSQTSHQLVSSQPVKLESSPLTCPETLPWFASVADASLGDRVKEESSMKNEALNPAASLLLHQDPVASPPLLKRSPSPVSSLDEAGPGSLADPLSPFFSPLSPSNMIGLSEPESPGSEDSFHGEMRRAAHLSAEQKRRCNLKSGFDLLQRLVPSLSQNPKVSKATMLQKTAEYCKKLKAERSQMQKEAAVLKQEIDSLNLAISQVQAQLPETGVPVTRQRKDRMKEMFQEYVRLRTHQNSKFWIFSVIISAVFDSYCNTVSTSSMEDLCRTSLTWLDQSCSLVTLRPNVLNALRKLSTSSPILTEPQKMKEFALQAVAAQSKELAVHGQTK